MTVCTRCLLLRLGRLRHLGHFQCDRRALCRAEYGLDRLLIERDLAVFGVDRQIGIGLVSHILHEGHIERQLHIVRALAVCLADLQHDLRGLFLRRLLDDLIVMLAVYLDRSDRLLRTVRIGLFADLDIRRRGGGCRTGSTGGGDVTRLLAHAARARYGRPVLRIEYLNIVAVVQRILCQIHTWQHAVHAVHPAGILALCKLADRSAVRFGDLVHIAASCRIGIVIFIQRSLENIEGRTALADPAVAFLCDPVAVIAVEREADSQSLAYRSCLRRGSACND